jgi:hypothetical protein
VSRLTILACSTALLGAALIPGSILAQQQPQTLRQQLVGAWSPINQTLPQLIPIVGTTPAGYLFLAGSGKFAVVFENSNRPRNSGRGDGIFASFGTWTVDEGARTRSLHTEGSMNSSLEGNDRKADIVLDRDIQRATGPEKTTTVYRRVAALPQGSTFRQGLLGAWEAVSYSPDAAGYQQLGANPKGYLMLGGSGRYVVIGKNPNRPKIDKISGDGFVANFGTWSIDEGAKALSRRVIGALSQNIEGTETKDTYVVNGNEMRLTGSDGKAIVVYRHLTATQ